MILTVGIVIGVGIFYKNESIISASHGNTGIVIGGWVLGGAISISSAIAFSLLSYKIKKSDNSTAELFSMSYGNKVGKYAKWGNSLIYYPVYSFTIALFSTAQLFKLFDFNGTNYLYPYILFLVAISITFAFIFSSFYADKIKRVINISTTAIKIIPFIIIVVICITTPFQANEHAYWNGNPREDAATIDPSEYNQTSNMSDIAIVFWIIPAIKFAFDGFTTVISNKKASNSKSLAWGITIGMVIISFLFIATTISVLKEGVSSIPDAIVSFFGGDIHNLTIGYSILWKIVSAIIAISGFGSTFIFITMWKRMSDQISIDHKKRRGFTFKIMFWGFIYSCLPWIVLTILLLTTNIGEIKSEGTSVVDEHSNIVLLVSFTLNGAIMLKFLYWKIIKKIKLSWIFVTFATISTIGIGLTAIWKIVDHLIINIILHTYEKGIFGWQKWSYVIVFTFAIMQIILSSVIGKLIIGKRKKNKLKELLS